MINGLNVNKCYLNDAGHNVIANKKNEYIVLHYTGCKNDTAEATASYFKKINKDKSRFASAHYVVDSKSIFKCVERKFVAWHCGDSKNKWTKGGTLYGKCTNYNSIGIEICNSLDKFDNKALENAIALTRHLMKKYHIDINHVIRHYDVSGKLCPWRATDENETYKNNWKYIKSACKLDSSYLIKIENDIIYKKKKTAKNWVIVGELSY